MSEKDTLIKTLHKLGKEKQSAYMRIEQIKLEEFVINRKLGEIYESTRTDIPK